MSTGRQHEASGRDEAHPDKGQPVNPRKKAVALRYAPDAQAPVVVAKGRGRIAEVIMEKAKEHGVPVQEDASLVEVLSQLELEQEIPPELYQLVAEILSFVYRSDREARKRMTAR